MGGILTRIILQSLWIKVFRQKSGLIFFKGFQSKVMKNKEVI